MHRPTLAVTLLFALCTANAPGRDDGPAGKAKPKTTAELMKRKLELGQQLLASLTTNDLARASKQAKELLEVRKEASWKAVKSEMYDTLSDDFARAAQQIIKAAKDDNREAAKLAYLGMTMACFNCHTYIRDRKDTGTSVR
jgi:hypothetical protein